MAEIDDMKMWEDIQRLSNDLSGLGARTTAISDRVIVNERDIDYLQQWQIEHEKWASSTEAHLASALDSLSKKLEDFVIVQRSFWDKAWNIIQPILLIALLGKSFFH